MSKTFIIENEMLDTDNADILHMILDHEETMKNLPTLQELIETGEIYDHGPALIIFKIENDNSTGEIRAGYEWGEHKDFSGEYTYYAYVSATIYNRKIAWPDYHDLMRVYPVKPIDDDKEIGHECYKHLISTWKDAIESIIRSK